MNSLTLLFHRNIKWADPKVPKGPHRRRENTFNMEQFTASINEFLTFRRYQILPDKGKISAAQAKKKAEDEYALFDPTQQIDSYFDKKVRKTLKDLA